ncbi:hypothetical protein NL455_29070, partial [Klebsiella pneumoniae]|nr:hypothetical protein [Klebsiella pneumoniae]
AMDTADTLDAVDDTRLCCTGTRGLRAAGGGGSAPGKEDKEEETLWPLERKAEGVAERRALELFASCFTGFSSSVDWCLLCC